MISIFISGCYSIKNIDLTDLNSIPPGDQRTLSLVYQDSDANWIEDELTEQLLRLDYRIIINKTERIYFEGSADGGFNQMPRRWDEVPIAEAQRTDLAMSIDCDCSYRFARNMRLQLISRSTGDLVWSARIGEAGKSYKIEKIQPLLDQAFTNY